MLRFCWLIFIGVSCNFCFAEPAGNNQVILDKKATAQADWKVGEVVAKGSIIPRNKYIADIERIFLGVTKDGYYRVQEFYILLASPFSLKKYPKGIVYSAPFNLIDKADVTHFNSDYNVKNKRNLSIEGAFSQYCDNGKLNLSGQYKQGKKVGYWYYYGGGHKVYLSEYYKEGTLVSSKKFN